MSLSRSLQYLFLAIIVTTVGFSLYQWNASRASTQKTAPNNGLVGYWSFDEGTGTQAGDASVNKNTGTLTNGPTWTTGKLGKAVSFDGVDDFVDAGNSANLMPTFPFTVSTWVKDGGVISTGDPANFSNGEYSGYTITMTSGGGINARIGSNGGNCSGSYRNDYFTTATTMTAGQWYHVTVVFTNASSFSIFVNGVSASVSQSGTNGLAIGYAAGARFRIGKYLAACSSTTVFYGGSIDETRVYNRALSGTEITNLYNLGAEKLNISPTTSLTSGLVGYWTFDGKDTPWTSSSAGTATDKSGNGNTGTLTNMNQSTSVIRGKIGQALNFDGVDDYMAVANNSSLQFSGAVPITLSAWVKPSQVTGFGTFLIKGRDSAPSSTNYAIRQDSTGKKLEFYFYNTGVANYNIWATSSNVFPTSNIWYHVVVTYTFGTGSSIVVYINGVSVAGTWTLRSGNETADVDTQRLTIGRWLYTGTQEPFTGQIDEVRIYNRALSATEVQSLYDLGASDKVNSSVSQNQGTGRLDSGLVGYWKLDDGSGTTATDSSVNGNNGTLTNGPTWGTGQIGGDVVFDGTNDYIATTGNTPFITLQLQPHSFFAWVYPLATSATQSIISYGQSDDNDWSSALGLRGASRTATWLGNGTNENSIAISTLNVPVNQWSFVGVVLNGTAQVTFYVNGQSSTITCTACGNVVTSDPFTLGATYYAANRGGFFSGSIDEARAYHRALSADEVSQIYRLTAPTGVDTSLKGYWSFDGSATNWTSSSAGTTSDLSGSGNTGTLTNMSQSTTPVRGKIGQALNFDGVNDYVNTGITSNTNFSNTTFSVSAWFKTTVASGVIVAKQDSTAGGWAVNFAGSSLSAVHKGTAGGNVLSRTTTATGLNDGNWHHIAFTMTTNTSGTAGQNIDLYLDGALNQGSLTNTAAIVTVANAVYIGDRYNTSIPFNGSIDEVRIYNRALSATEVAALYNSGR